MALLLLEDSNIGGKLHAVLKSLTVMDAVKPGGIIDSTGSSGTPGQVLVVEGDRVVWSDALRQLQELAARMDGFLRAINEAVEIDGATYP